ncbi:MAG: MotA/TolQ/ExbB proton channel family protein, partial [Elusimicrobia bacterium]|nr:MotA/TolQ/ExbB proton channel family protein [Elusimicrobiota bacterium]
TLRLRRIIMGSFKEILVAGGPILFVLAALSIYSVAVIWERWSYYRRNLSGLSDFIKKVKKLAKSGEMKKAADACAANQTPASAVLLKVLTAFGARAEKREYANGAIEWYTTTFHKRLTALATIGSTAPFIGLFGTVLGVMRAFRDLSVLAGAGPSVVALGISEALINTAAGLFVAIPAIFAYNYFISKANKFLKDLEWACEEIINSSEEAYLESGETDAEKISTARRI